MKFMASAMLLVLAINASTVLQTNMKRAQMQQESEPLAEYGHTQFSHLTESEFLRQFTGFVPLAKGASHRPPLVLTEQPVPVDWVAKGAVTDVKTQVTPALILSSCALELQYLRRASVARAGPSVPRVISKVLSQAVPQTIPLPLSVPVPYPCQTHTRDYPHTPS